MVMHTGLRELLALLVMGSAVAGCSADYPMFAGAAEQPGVSSGGPLMTHYSPGDAVAKLRQSGLDPISFPVLKRSNYVVDAVKKDSNKVRVVIAARSGDIVAVHAVPKSSCRDLAAGLELSDGRTSNGANLRPLCFHLRRATRVAKLTAVRRDVPSAPPSVSSTAAIGLSAPISLAPGAFPPVPALTTVTSVPPNSPPVTVLVLASDISNARTGYEELTVQDQSAAQSNRTHSLSATCIGLLAKDRKGFALVTNSPKEIAEFENGDIINLTGPLCPAIAESANDLRLSMSIKKTGELSTNIAKPKFQHLVLGDVLSPPTPSTAVNRSTQAFRECEFCPEMILLPGGTITMGGSAEPAERPIHQVRISPVVFARGPVTIGQWRQCVLALACSSEPIRDRGYNDTPVHDVSWDDAQLYVSWISQVTKKNYRLPTEAEWEYAARAGSNSDYWWGDRVVDGMANCRECGEPFKIDMPIRATSFAPNPFGLYDMAGGVAQWVADCWHDSYDGAPSDGSSWEASNCSHHVLRGGSWRDDAKHLRAASRDHYGRGQRDPSHGFRVARSP